MKKLLYPVLISMVALLATSCIKDLESDGVKSMRTSQAALLTAMATAQTTNATADAALKAAQAALTSAQADNAKAESAAYVQQMTITNAAATEKNRHDAALNALNESLQAAKDAQTKATLTAQMAEEAAQSAFNLNKIANDQTMLDASIETNKIYNDMALLNAKTALDKAQKDNDINLQKQAQQYATNLASLKTQVQSDLVAGYNTAYYSWSNQSVRINDINKSIIQLGMDLNDAKTTDSSDVNLAKRNLDGQKVIIDTLNAQLAKAKTIVTSNSNSGISTLIANYKAEKTTLEAAQSALRISERIEYTDYSNAFDAYSSAYDAYNALKNKETAAQKNVNYAEGNLQAATDGFEKTAGSFTVYFYSNGYYVVSSSTPVDAGWQHNNNGSFVSTVSIKEAVAAEKGDTTALGAYLSPQDKEEVVSAQDAETTAKARITAMQANYATVYDIWLAAHNATLNALNQYNAAKAAYNTAYNKYHDWNSSDNQLSRNSSRISTLSSNISILESSSGQALVNQLESDIKSAQDQLDNSYTPQYAIALKSFDTNKPKKDLNNNAIQISIDNLKASLTAEQAKLVLYKANLDEWVAKINAALP